MLFILLLSFSLCRKKMLIMPALCSMLRLHNYAQNYASTMYLTPSQGGNRSDEELYTCSTRIVSSPTNGFESPMIEPLI